MKINKKILISIILVLLIAGGVGAWALYNNKNQPAEISEDGINYGPPTEEEKKETEQFKEDLINKPDNTSQSSNNEDKKADVTMTYVYYEDGKVTSAGIVSNVFEDGGKCTLTLTKGSKKVTGTSNGIRDVNKTTCPPISIKKSQLQSGTWSAVLSYDSSSIAKGFSSKRTINVP